MNERIRYVHNTFDIEIPKTYSTIANTSMVLEYAGYYHIFLYQIV